MAHPIRPDEYQEVNNFYTATVYEKGAEVIRMQHTLLGDDGFRRGMDLYFARHDGQAVTCDDFVASMQDANAADLRQFRRWYAQAGTPVVHVGGRYDASARTYTLDVTQATAATPGQTTKLPFHIPLAVGLVAPDGADLPLRLDGEAAAGATTRVLDVRDAAQSFRFVDVPAAPVPSLARGYSAPVKLEFGYSDADLALLAAHDSDAVNRWDAAQRSFARAIAALAAAHRAGRPLALPPPLAMLVGHLLDDAASDPALLALALSPPDVAYLVALETPYDVDGVVAAREFVVRELAARLRDRFERVYDAHRARAPYAPTRAQGASRRLRNVALRYLGALDDAPAHALAVAQFDTADNMTDSIAALAALADSRSAARDDLFARFEARWRDEPLVLDKWFALEATSARADALARVKALLVHPRFNARNPNRVRALVGAFALRNFKRFHAADASGYTFAADQVVALDAMNPQLAARIAGAFELWKRYPEPRRGMMQAVLQRLAAMPDLSPDVGEIVTRSLA